MVQRNRTRKGTELWPDLALCLGFFALAFTIRLLYLHQIKRLPLFYGLVSDSLTYDEWAQQIADGDWLGQGVFFQAPLYPYFLGLLETIFGHDLFLIRVVQAILGALSCSLIFWAGKVFFSRSAGVWAGIVLALYAPAIFFDGLIQKACLDLFLLSVLLVLLGKTQRSPHQLYFAGVGVVLGLLGLSRENALILAPIIIGWVWFYFLQHDALVRLCRVALFLSGLAVILIPVGLRNLKVGGEFTITTSQMGTQLFIGNNASASGFYAPLVVGHGDPRFERDDATHLAEQALSRPLSPGEVSAYWRGRALEFIKSHPGDWLRLIWKKSLMTWNIREAEDIDDFYIYQEWSWLLASLNWLNFSLLAPLAAFGAVVTWESRRRLWLLYLMVASLAFSVALFYVFARYRFSLVPFLILFAGAGLAEIPSILKERRLRQLAVGLAMLVATVIAVRWPVIPPPGPGVAGYNNLGIAFGKAGMVKQAVDSYQQALRLDPTSAVVHYNIGSLLGLDGELKQARDHLQDALKHNPDYLEARNNLGNVLIMQGDFIGAIEQFHMALRLNPAFKKLRFNLAVALIKAGDFAAAREELTQFVKMSNDPFEAYRANALLSQARLDKGIEHLKQALALPERLSESASLARILIW